jgi:TIR domain
MSSVFLSYARSDADMADRIAADLKAEGINVWLDRDRLRPGESWAEQIESAISKADFLLVLISRASLDSKWVRTEYQAAFRSARETGGTRVIPVLLENVSELPPFLAQIQYADFSKSYYAGIRSLLRALQKSVGPKPNEVVDAGKLARQVAGEVAKLLGLERRPEAELAHRDPTLVFVITSFAADMDPIFEGIDAAARSVGLTAKRVKDVQGDYRITDQIIEMIQSAFLVVADLSHERPNVYFELGYARGLGKTVITIARKDTNIHFDVKDWVYIPYVDSRLLERDLAKRFEYEIARTKKA